MWLSLVIILVTSFDTATLFRESDEPLKQYQYRIKKEFADLSTSCGPYCNVSLVDNDIYRWRVDITGPEETPYEAGHFKVSIVIPGNYPFIPPTAKFETKIYHPDVKKDSGEISQDLYRSGWGPLKTIRWVIEVILSFLYYPSLEHSVEPEIARQVQDNYDQYVATAKLWVQQYAR